MPAEDRPEPTLEELESEAARLATHRDLVQRDWERGEATEDECLAAESLWSNARLAWLSVASGRTAVVGRDLILLATLRPDELIQAFELVGKDVRGSLAELRRQADLMRKEIERQSEWLRNTHYDIRQLKRERDQIRAEIDGLRFFLEEVKKDTR